MWRFGKLILSTSAAACLIQAAILSDEIVLKTALNDGPEMHLHSFQVEAVVGGFRISARNGLEVHGPTSWANPEILTALIFSNGLKIQGVITAIDNSDEQRLITGRIDTGSRPSVDTIQEIDLLVIGGRYTALDFVRSFQGGISPDIACFRDYRSALRLDGVRQRQALLSAMSVGCVRSLESDWSVISAKPVPGFPGASFVILEQVDTDGSTENTKGFVNTVQISHARILVLKVPKEPVLATWHRRRSKP